MPLLPFLLFFFTTPIVAQFALNWEQNFNGNGDHSERFRDMVVDDNGHVFMTGYSVEYNEDRDLLIVKYDQSGALVWADTYKSAGRNDDEGHAIALDPQGNVLVTGEADKDFITLKYDTNGNQLWAKTYEGGGMDDDFAYKIVTDNDGNVFVAGQSEELVNGNADITLVKYSTAGDELWSRSINSMGAEKDLPYDLVHDGLGNVYLAGRMHNGVDYDGILRKYSTNGNVLWSKTFDGGDNDRATALFYDGTHIYVAGRFNNGDDDDIMLRKYNSSGNELWSRLYSTPEHDRVEAMTGNTNGVWIAGRSKDGADYDVKLLKYDSAGNLMENQAYVASSGGESRPNDIMLLDSDVYVTGYEENNGQEDLLLLKYNSAAVLQWAATYAGSGNGNDEGEVLGLSNDNKVLVAGRNFEIDEHYNGLLQKYNAIGVAEFTSIYATKGDNQDKMTDMAVGNNGNIYYTGFSYEFGEKRNMLTLMKDAQGNVLWSRMLNSIDNEDDEGVAITTDDLGNCYVTGYLDNDIVVVKYNSIGDKVWEYNYDGAAMDEDRSSAILLDPDGSIYVAGRTDVDPSANEDDDILLLKIESTGILDWEMTRPNIGKDRVYDMTMDNENNVYLAGKIEVGADEDAVILRYSPSGNLDWTSIAASSVQSRFRKIKFDGTHLVACGFFDSFTRIARYQTNALPFWTNDMSVPTTDQELIIEGNNLYMAGRYETASAEEHAYITKYDLGGNFAWEQFIDETTENRVSALVEDPTNGVLYAAGSAFDGSNTDLSIKALSVVDGEECANYNYGQGNNGDDEAKAIHLNSAGEILVGANFYVDTQQDNISTLKVDFQKVVAINNDFNQGKIKVFPTVLEESKVLNINGLLGASTYQFALYSSDGKQVFSQEGKAANTSLQLPLQLSKGTYFYTLQNDKDQQTGQVFCLE